AAAGCSAPADIAPLVAFAIFTQAFEFAAAPALLDMALFHGDLAATDQVDSVLFGFFQIRVNANNLSQRNHGPALSDTQGALGTPLSITEVSVAALTGVNNVAGDAGSCTGRHGNFQLGRAGSKSGRCVVDQLSRYRDRAGVLQLQ